LPAFIIGYGREGRYVRLDGDGEIKESCCNKHFLCKSHEELNNELRELKCRYVDLLQSAKEVITFKESTDTYKSAQAHIESLG